MSEERTKQENINAKLMNEMADMVIGSDIPHFLIVLMRPMKDGQKVFVMTSLKLHNLNQSQATEHLEKSIKYLEQCLKDVREGKPIGTTAQEDEAVTVADQFSFEVLKAEKGDEWKEDLER